MPRKVWLLTSFCAATTVSFLGYTLFLRHGKPLGDSPHVEFPTTVKSPEEIEEFLSGNYAVIDRVELLPEPVRFLYTEVGGTRFTMANPGKKFEKTDFITDASIPMKRLILAGNYGNKCFVHYEHGGIGLHSDLALFQLTSPTDVQPVWEGVCGDVGQDAAKNLAELRMLVARGQCQDKNRLRR